VSISGDAFRRPDKRREMAPVTRQEIHSMSLALYAHPFSSYCQKVLTALYENATPFEYRALGPDHPETMRELTDMWPMKRFPVLVDGDRPVIESSVIIEYLGLKFPGTVRLIPDDPQRALDVRFMDRFFDLYVATP
jgi:glutathione S-transferase